MVNNETIVSLGAVTLDDLFCQIKGIWQGSLNPCLFDRGIQRFLIQGYIHNSKVQDF